VPGKGADRRADGDEQHREFSQSGFGQNLKHASISDSAKSRRGAQSFWRDGVARFFADSGTVW
jgi:hypothetical protein